MSAKSPQSQAIWLRLATTWKMWHFSVKSGMKKGIRSLERPERRSALSSRSGRLVILIHRTLPWMAGSPMNSKRICRRRLLTPVSPEYSSRPCSLWSASSSTTTTGVRLRRVLQGLEKIAFAFPHPLGAGVQQLDEIEAACPGPGLPPGRSCPPPGVPSW